VSAWSHKTVLVTGGSAGLGLAIAEAFASAGARVAIVGRNTERLVDAQRKLQALSGETISIVADVTRDDDVQRMIAETVARFGTLDVLVNNVGVSMRGEALATPVEEYRRLLDLNFLSVVRCTQAAASELKATRGSVVMIGSLASKAASRYLGAYPASKFPLAAFAQQLRLELRDSGVHTLLVCPGPIRRDDAGVRYDGASPLPESAKRPGGGVKLKGLDPAYVARRIVKACERRQAELVLPGRARLMFALAQLWPALGDWIVDRMTR
jgi:short-subunit dehydrogenase